MKNILTLLAVVLTLNGYSSTLVAEAGNNAIICGTGSVQLGGTPTAIGGTAPYAYSWFPSIGLSDSTLPNPVASPSATTTYILTVIDFQGTETTDTVVVNVGAVPQVDAGPDILACNGSVVQLKVKVTGAQLGLAARCSHVTDSSIGSGTLSHYPMPILQRPSLLGNFYKSYRNQMLYKAEEIMAALGGAKTISRITFDVAVFNSNSILSNYTIKIGSTNLDSLSVWDNSLTQVYAHNYPPLPGSAIINLDTGFIWDGVSNLIVEVTTYNPSTFGNQPNSTACTNTTFNSYLYSIANTDLRGGTDSATVSNLRPNITFGYCAAATIPYTFLWSPPNFLNSGVIFNPQTQSIANSFTVTVTNSTGCTAIDSVKVSLSPLPGLMVDTIFHPTCASVPNGEIQVSGAGISPFRYSINHAPLQASPYFTGLTAGNYSLEVSDSLGCRNGKSAILNPDSVLMLSIVSQTGAPCFQLAQGSVTLNHSGGVSPVTYSINGTVWSPLPTFTGLIPATYTGTVRDSAGCVQTIPVSITSSTPYPIDTAIITNVSCYGASNGAIDLMMIGSPGDYFFSWSNFQVLEDVSNAVGGRYFVIITDTAGCQITDSFDVVEPAALSVITSHTDATCGLANGTLTVTITGGIPPYTFLGNPTPAGTSTITNLATGVYAGNVIDANGCSYAATETISGPLFGVSASIVNDGDGIYPDTLETNITGGCAPYQYAWSTGETNSTTQAVGSGVYTVTVFDCQACSALATIRLGLPSVSVLKTDVICNGFTTGSATLTAVGGTPPYQYSIDWGNTFQSSNTFTNLAAGTYPVMVTDAALNSVVDSFTIAEPGEIYTSGFVRNVSCFGRSDGWIDITAYGGTLPYFFAWGYDSVPSGPSVGGLTAGNYYVTITDVNGCSAVFIYTVTEPPLLQAHLASATGGSLPDTLSAVVTGGIYMTYEYLASNLSTDSSTYMDLSAQGTCFWVQVTDSNGCVAITDTFCYCNDQCVWPGDANYDGVADNTDLLPIGLAYGTTGPARSQVNTGWAPHSAANWTDTLSNGANYKHIDCDGSGLIDAEDTLAIIQNYGFIHAKTGEDEPWRANAPELYVRLVPDTTRAGDTLYANLMLGDATIPAANVYGLAFTVNYDPTVVDSPKTKATFGTSWLGTASDKISIAKDLPALGQIKCAVTRIDHTTRGGNGQIGVVAFVITTDNINGKDFGYFNNKVWISDVLMIDNSGIELPLNAGADSTFIEYEPLSTGNIKLEDNSFKIQPNPAANAVQLSVTKELIGAEVRLTDLSGRVLKAQPVNALSFTINTSELSGGIYLVQAINAKGTITKRLIIAR